MKRYVSYNCRFFSLISGTFYILNILVLKKIIKFVQNRDCVVAEYAQVDAAEVAVTAVNHRKYNSLKYNSLDYKDWICKCLNFKDWIWKCLDYNSLDYKD